MTYRVTIQTGKQNPSFVAYQGEDKAEVYHHYTEHMNQNGTTEIHIYRWNPGNGGAAKGWETCVLFKRYRDW